MSEAQGQNDPSTCDSGRDSPVDYAALESNLKKILAGRLRDRASTLTIERQPNLFRGAFPSEIVTCSVNNGSEIQLFLKYFVPNTHTGHGYWGDVEYEARVYQKILRGMPLSLPEFYGLLTSTEVGRQCLIVGYVPDSMRLNKCPERTIVLAARWIGRFHALASRYAQDASSSFLNSYGEEYFAGWARRTLEFSHPLLDHFPWLPELVRRFIEAAPALVQGPKTVVHGEFYPHNIVVRSDVLYPVDWASAAIGRGEIDLASLTEGWGHTGLIEECEEEYARARWPDGPPGDYREVLALARVYWPLRWLGDQPDMTLVSKTRGYPLILQEEGKRTGLL